MGKLTLKPDIVVKWILLIASAGFLAHGVGYIFDDREQVTRLEGSSKWCLYGEYGSVKDYNTEKTHLGNAFIDIGHNKVRVFTHCEDI